MNSIIRRLFHPSIVCGWTRIAVGGAPRHRTRSPVSHRLTRQYPSGIKEGMREEEENEARDRGANDYAILEARR